MNPFWGFETSGEYQRPSDQVLRLMGCASRGIHIQSGYMLRFACILFVNSIDIVCVLEYWDSKLKMSSYVQLQNNTYVEVAVIGNRTLLSL